MLYINGRPVNPLMSFLMSALVLAGMVLLGVLLLPVIGGILLFVLLLGLAVVLYGVYWRWRHGDPLKKRQVHALRKRGEHMTERDVHLPPRKREHGSEGEQQAEDGKNTAAAQHAIAFL